ncbi:SDR family NAD(P)-dependent oxidoreductase [Kitasatospora aureofaciens]|uniref:SDR family NAD(P)-dependent oxidoreductase n=1 Tax=Kitasatospora aureofaciens TaxID=1894 RepID=UPI003B977C58
MLSALAQRSTGEHDCVVEPSCRRDRPEEHTLVTALARLHVAGVPVDWTALLAGTGAARVDLPTYPFQRERYWPERAPEPAAAGGDPVDAAFWSAVERADTAALGTALGLADDSSLAELLPALSTWRRRQSARTDADRLRYRAAWRPYAVPAGPEALPEGWLAVLPAGRADDPWTTAALTALGPDVLRLETGRDGRAALVERLAPHAGAVTGVISLLAAEDTLPTGLARPDELLAALGEAGVEAPLWCLTRGAVAVVDTEAPDRPAQAAAWGIGRVTALEHPRRWGGLVDLAEAPDTRTAARLRALLTAPDGEDQLALRPSGAFARRLVRATTDADARPWTPRGTVLLIGDPDGHAAPTARWLARNGARQVVLLTAEDTGSSAVERIEAELAGHGAGLSVVTGAPGDPAALASALDRPELTAVLHTGRTAAPGTPDEQLAGLLAELAALDTALGDRPLDAFLLFGSIAGTWGVKGRADEAAAGALLEAAAQSRRAAGRAALAVAWGAWTGSTPDSLAAHLRANGLPPLAPERALTALAAAADGPAAVTVAEVTWERFAPAFGETRTTRLFAELPEARRTAEPQQPGGGSARAEALRADLRDRSAAERTEALLALVRAEAAAVLGHADADDVPAGHPFKDLGFDSLTAVDLRNRLGTATGLKLPATLVFDYPSPAALAAHLRAELLDEAGEAERPVAAVDTDDPIVIVGMGCRYPGGVRSPEDLWQLLLDGTDAIGPFPTDRGWDLDRLAHGDRDGRGRSVTGHGGFLYDAAEFDAAFFGVSPREALVVDPQQRLLLETAWEALERAGIDPAGLRGGDTGVFVGGGSGDYRPAIGQLGHVETAQSASLLSGRLSYTLGLEGPSVSVDTACSSSLVALHLAAQALRAGECSLALAGGVTVMSSPVGFVEFGEMGALSPDGRCRAFSDGADGTGWSEGVGVLVVERRSDAERLGHRVLAVLRGSAVNQDGASNGITAPNGPSQQRVIRRALAGAGLTPGEVDAVEAHGTGTRLGDPIEAQALLATYGQDRERPVLIGALKSNLGHTQAASGVGGVIKMVLAMRHGLLPRTLHLDTPSAHVDWTAGAAELLTEARGWPESGRPRRAGVSAFGASGTNAHVILEQPAEEPPPAAGDRPDDRTLPVPLSAATPEALREQAARLLDRLAGHPGLTVRDLGHSLATTRTLLDHRAVLLAADREELVRGLRALADGSTGGEAVQGSARSARTAFLFPGQGSQRPGAGSGLYASEPVFAEALDAAVEAAEEEVLPLLTDGVSIAAVNGPRAVVLSGDADAVERIAAGLAADGRRTRRLRVSHAFHSVHMDAMLDDFERTARGIAYTAPRIPLVSNLTGELVTGETGAHYWVRHVREAVRFADGLATLAARGVRRHLELGPDGVLSALVQAGGADQADPARPVVTATALRHGRDERTTLLTAVARLHADGLAPHWPAVFEGTGARRVDLPTYPFQRQRYWPEPAPAPAPATADGEFWTALRTESLDALADTLDVDGDALAKVLPALRDWHDRREEQAAVDALRRRIVWQPLDRARSGAPAGTWLAVLPAGHADDAWAQTVLGALGPDTARLTVAAGLDRARLAEKLAELPDTGRGFSGVLSLLALDESTADGTPAGPARTATLLQALGDARIGAPLWCLTREAVAAAPGDRVTGLPQAAVWGLGRVAALELPQRWGGLIDLPGTVDRDAAALLAAVLAEPAGEDQLAVRRTGLFARRLAATPGGSGDDQGLWEPTGTVLITGGTGALGGEVARGLAAAGARHLLLLSRRGPDAPGAAGLREDLTAAGATVTITACDVADREALAAVLAAVPADQPLSAVVHAAGVLDDGVIDGLDPDRFTAVHRAKAASALLLDELTADQDLAVFALFSSASAAVGNPGQGNYAAANAILDALAERRRAHGRAATSIAWGAWGGGMAADARAAEAARRTGIRPLDPAAAVSALRRTVLDDAPTTLVADVDPERFVRAFTAVRPSRLLAQLPGYAEPQGPGGDTGNGRELRAELAGLPPARRAATVLGLVRGRAAEVLGLPGIEAVGPDKAFRDLGFDSLGAVELRNRLGAATGLDLSPTLVFDHPSPSELAEHLLGLLLTGPGQDSTDAEPERDRLRALLESVPLDRLRRSGVLDELLKLADGAADGGAAEDADAIDAMDLDDLVQAALRNDPDHAQD